MYTIAAVLDLMRLSDIIPGQPGTKIKSLVLLPRPQLRRRSAFATTIIENFARLTLPHCGGENCWGFLSSSCLIVARHCTGSEMLQANHDAVLGFLPRSVQQNPVLPVFLSVLLFAGCAYDPPVLADHDSEKYRSDLAQCQQTVDDKVDLQNRSTFPAFVISPFTGPPRKHAGTRDCMVAKGYSLSEP